MANIFNANRTNALSNALYEKMKNATSYDAFESEACFHFLKDDETYNITEQIHGFKVNALCGATSFTFPCSVYDPEHDEWQSEQVYKNAAVPGWIEYIFESGVSVGFQMYFLIGSYIFVATVNMETAEGGMYWCKVSFGQDTENNTAKTKRVNGLHNAMMRKIDQVKANDALDSDACFEFLANDETYNIKAQIENGAIGFTQAMLANISTNFGVLLQVPGIEYDQENSEWSDTSALVLVPAVGFVQSNDNISSSTGHLVFCVSIGKYACQIDCTITSASSDDSTPGESLPIITTTVNSVSWSKVAFDS